MSTKQNAREKFLALVAHQGWVPDPSKTMSRLVRGTRYGLTAEYEDVQNPYAFMYQVFDDETGQWAGRWHIELDYSQQNGYRMGTGITLRRVTMHHTPAVRDDDGNIAEGERRLIGVLRNVNNRRNNWLHSDLFDVTGRGSDGETIYNSQNDEITLRQRAEKLVANPALTAWLALENEHQRKTREAAEAERRRRETEESARPLPVTVEQESYGSEWKTLSRKLAQAAQAVEKANGRSDLPALIAKVDEALGEVIQTLNPEAKAALDELMSGV